MLVREPKTQRDIPTRPPLPPFTRETAIQKVRLAEDGWNSRDPEKVALAYTIDSRWRNRADFPNGRQEIIQFLKRKWAKELDYRLIKELWAYTENRIAVRASLTNGTMTLGIGSAHMGMRMGFWRPWPDAVSIRVHQRSPDQGIGEKISLAARPPSGCASWLKRSRFIAVQKNKIKPIQRKNSMKRNSPTKP